MFLIEIFKLLMISYKKILIYKIAYFLETL